MVEHHVRDVGAGGSNPLSPTNFWFSFQRPDLLRKQMRAMSIIRSNMIVASRQTDHATIEARLVAALGGKTRPPVRNLHEFVLRDVQNRAIS